MRKLTAVLVASVLAFGSMNIVHAADMSAAQNTQNDSGTLQHKGPRGMMHDPLFKNLNLTDAQKQQIRDLMQSQREQHKPDFKSSRQAMHDLITADHFDKAKAQALIDTQSEMHKARMLSHLEIQNKIYHILTPEQQKQFNTNFEKHLTERPGHPSKMPAGE